ncbi:MAG: ATP-binding protein, partial [Promethearchaeota archaeon]
WIRKILMISFIFILMFVSIINAIILFVTESAISYFSIIVFIISSLSFVLLHYGKYTTSSHLLIISINLMIILRGLEVYSAYMFTFLSLILIISSILAINPIFSVGLFLMDIIAILIGLKLHKFTLGQPIDPDTGIYYANTITDLLPNILISFIISMVLHYIIITIINTQQRQFDILKNTQKKLIEQEKLISLQTLAGGIAHDFNNLLTSIMGVLSLLNSDFEGSKETKELIEEAEKASIRAKLLTSQLQNFSKSQKPEIELIDNVKDLVKDVVRFSSRGSHIKPKIHFQDNIRQIEADKGQISQVIQNLVINAIQAMPDGGNLDIFLQNVYISKSNEFNLPKGYYLKIDFQDTGIGISEKIIETIFDPFVTTKKEGTGLGLYISKIIIKNHSGFIGVKSKNGKGATFTVLIPTISQFSKIEQIKRKDLNEISGRVLVMDDDKAILKTLNLMLRKLGLTVELSENGTEAFEKYLKAYKEGNLYDFLILDCTVPGGKGGEECLADIKKINPNVKAILSSGYKINEFQKEYNNESSILFLHKPYTINDLSILILKLLEL